MISLDVIDTDAFLDMPLSSQLLYFHLNSRADDDGFISNPKGIMRKVGSSDDDMKVLIAKKFVISFEDGVVVIKHWRINNYIRKDIYQETNYLNHKQTLLIRANGAYTLNEDGRAVKIPNGHFNVDDLVKRLTEPQDDVHETSTGRVLRKELGQVRLDKEVSSSEETDVDVSQETSVIPTNENGDEMVSNGFKRNEHKVVGEGRNKVATRIQTKFVEMAYKELEVRPMVNIVGYKMVNRAMTTGKLNEEQIYDLFEEWFGSGRPEEELLNINRALSDNQINGYKIRNQIS